MTIDKDALEKSRRDEEFRKLLDEWRLQSELSRQSSLQSQEAELSKARQRYHNAEHNFKEATHDRHRIHSTESVSAIIASFKESLAAIGAMKAALWEIAARKAWLNVSKTVTDSNAWPKIDTPNGPASVLDIAGSMLRSLPRVTRQFLDNRLGTDIEGYFQDPLPPAIIPYLAEVDNNGVLSCNLEENEPAHITRAYVDQYQDAFTRAIIRGMKEARDTDNQPMFDIDETNPAAIVIINHETGYPLTPEEFADFRDNVLTQALTQEFGEEFRAQGPASPSMGR